ncbi:hypothetical protein LCGC14_1564480, partial [marine sediment metagenome]
KDNGIVFVEAADHPITPVATKGQVWVKNAAPNELWFTDDAGTDAQLAAGGGGDRTISKDLESPTSSEDLALGFFFSAVTISEVQAVVRGSATPSATIQLHHSTDRSAAGNVVLNPATAITNTTTGQNLTAFTDATIPQDSWLWLETTAMSGTVDELSITIIYSYD